MTTAAATGGSGATGGGVVRVRAFIDFWNFQLALKKWRSDFNLDWKGLGPWLTTQAGQTMPDVSPANMRYQGLHVFLSYNATSGKDDALKRWATTVLDRFPGVEVVIKERRPKNAPNCPTCHTPVETCPHCSASMRGTMEKGIDTAIVTDMIRLAWEDAYDVAVLMSADADFIPGVEFLNTKGRKVIHAGFPPSGMDLARKCWASFDVRTGLDQIQR